jgi:calcineurin-like phosphoesterase family protein
MGKRFVIADTHFNHNNIIQYSQRPFPNVEGMNWQMIQRWNSVVSKEDKVFMLGDFGIGSKIELQNICQQLNGNKFLIMGNHDMARSVKWWHEVGFQEVSKYGIILNNNTILCHEPIPTFNSCGWTVIHGHLHDKTIVYKNYINVSVEHINYTPILLDSLIGG